MKPQWENLSQALSEFNTLLHEYITNTAIGRREAKAAKVLGAGWDRILRAHNEYDKLVEPLPPAEVKLPFESQEFAETWQLYKDSILEEKGIFFTSRKQILFLRWLKKESANDEQSAIDMLVTMGRLGYITLYSPSNMKTGGNGSTPAQTPEINMFTQTTGDL